MALITDEDIEGENTAQTKEEEKELEKYAITHKEVWMKHFLAAKKDPSQLNINDHLTSIYKNALQCSYIFNALFNIKLI